MKTRRIQRGIRASVMAAIVGATGPIWADQPVSGILQRPGSIATSDISTEFQLQPLPNTTSAPVITAMAGSTDGRFLAVAGDDHAIRILDTTTGNVLQTVIGHKDWVRSLLFVYPSQNEQSMALTSFQQPDDGIVSSESNIQESGSQPANSQANTEASHVGESEATVQDDIPDLYSAGHDGRVLRWKYTFPLEAEEIAIVPYAIRSISISTVQNLLAIGGFSDELLIYDLAEGIYVQRLKCDFKDQRTVRFSPDGKKLLSGAANGEICVWDSLSGELIVKYREHQRRVHTAAFSADGQSITSAGDDRRVVRYDIRNQQVQWSNELALAKLSAIYLVNDDMVAVAGADNQIRLLDAASESVIVELSGHSGTVAVMTACGEALASGSFDTTVRLWNLPSLENRRARGELPTSRTPIRFDDRTQIR